MTSRGRGVRFTTMVPGAALLLLASAAGCHRDQPAAPAAPPTPPPAAPTAAAAPAAPAAAAMPTPPATAPAAAAPAPAAAAAPGAPHTGHAYVAFELRPHDTDRRDANLTVTRNGTNLEVTIDALTVTEGGHDRPLRLRGGSGWTADASGSYTPGDEGAGEFRIVEARGYVSEDGSDVDLVLTGSFADDHQHRNPATMYLTTDDPQSPDHHDPIAAVALPISTDAAAMAAVRRAIRTNALPNPGAGSEYEVATRPAAGCAAGSPGCAYIVSVTFPNDTGRNLERRYAVNPATGAPTEAD